MNRYILFVLIAILYCVSLNSVMWQNAAPIRQGVNIEWFRTAATTADNCAIYVWSDTKAGERDLYAQKVDATGNMVWGQPVLIDGKIDRQEDPVITRTSDNNFIIAWIDFSNDFDGNVYAQKINPAGQLMWQTGGVPVCIVSDIQISLNIEPDSDGGAYVVWNDTRNPGIDIYGQHLSSTGTPLWITNGIPIANGTGDEASNTMWSDGNGGMIIGYVYSSAGGFEDIYIKRFLPNGTMAWDQPVHITPNTSVQNKLKMSAINENSFVFVWEDFRNGNSDIFAQCIDLNGNPMWDEPVEVYADNFAGGHALQENPRIVQTNDNAVIIVWEDKRNDTVDPDLFAQKLDMEGSRLWDVNGVPVTVSAFGQRGPRMTADNDGGCYIVWDDARNGNTPQVDIYAQHLSSTGSSLWLANGKPICTAPNEQSGSLIKSTGNNLYVNWMDMRNGSVGIYYQVLDSLGNATLAENGIQVFWGLSGDATLKQILHLKRQNDSVVIWQDTRFSNMGYQIFFQFLNPDGSVDLETNGRPVTTLSGYDQITPAAVVLPDDKIAIFWEERSPSPRIMGQLIDSNGNRLWGDLGMTVTEDVPLRQQLPQVSFEDGALYVGWSNLDVVVTPFGNRFIFHVYGQKIVGNQKMWGNNGVLISQIPSDNLLNECLLENLVGRYFVWTRTSIDINTFGYMNVWAKLMSPEGNTAPGWSDYGVLTSNYWDEDTKQYLPKSTITDAGLFVQWVDIRLDNSLTIYGQLISPTGQLLWNESGLPLVDSGREQSEFSLLGGNAITFAWKENTSSSNQDIAIQKISNTGSPLWTPLCNYVVQKDTTQATPNLIKFPHSGYAVAWEDYSSSESDIYVRFISYDGQMLGTATGNVVCDNLKDQLNPMMVVLDNVTPNEALVVWSDGRSSGKTPIFGLYAQKILNETPDVGVDDISLVSSLFTLKQNYPNPFNPETKISFTLSKDVKDADLSVFNIKGQKVITLLNGKAKKGINEIIWNGIDDNKTSCASGIYFYKFSSGNHTETKKMILMK